jgi:hypothetical protein
MHAEKIKINEWRKLFGAFVGLYLMYDLLQKKVENSISLQIVITTDINSLWYQYLLGQTVENLRVQPSRTSIFQKEIGKGKKGRRTNQEDTFNPLLDLFACSFKNHRVCANKQAWQHSASWYKTLPSVPWLSYYIYVKWKSFFESNSLEEDTLEKRF